MGLNKCTVIDLSGLDNNIPSKLENLIPMKSSECWLYPQKAHTSPQMWGNKLSSSGMWIILDSGYIIIHQ